METRIIVAVLLFIAIGMCQPTGALVLYADPDSFQSEGYDLSNAFPYISLSAYGTGITDPAVVSRAEGGPRYRASTGSWLFGNTANPGQYTENLCWTSPYRHMRVDFAQAADYFAVDVIADVGDPEDWARVKAYDSANQLVARIDVVSSNAVPVTAVIDHRTEGPDFSYVLIENTPNNDGHTFALDNMVYNVRNPIPEPRILTLLAAALVGIGVASRSKVSTNRP